MLLSDEHYFREKFEHERPPGSGLHKNRYGDWGYRWKDHVLRVCNRFQANDVLDYGAGRATLAEALKDAYVSVHNFDPITFPKRPAPADLVVCTDVLCFVEPKYIEPVLNDMASLALKGLFIVVPLHPQEKARPGLTHYSLESWHRRLSDHWPDHEADFTWEGTPRLRFTCSA